MADCPSGAAHGNRQSLHLHFGEYEIDLAAFELRRDGQPCAVEPQVLELLAYLVRNAGRLVTKADLIEHVWDGRIVSDSTLASRVKSARRAIGDDGEQQRLIKTVHSRGVRFVGELRVEGVRPTGRPRGPRRRGRIASPGRRPRSRRSLCCRSRMSAAIPAQLSGRWPLRGHHHRPVAVPAAAGDRARFLLPPSRRRHRPACGGADPRRRLRGDRQRAPTRIAPAPLGAADGGGQPQRIVGRALRPQHRGRVRRHRRAGADHRRHARWPGARRAGQAETAGQFRGLRLRATRPCGADQDRRPSGRGRGAPAVRAGAGLRPVLSAGPCRPAIVLLRDCSAATTTRRSTGR